MSTKCYPIKNGSQKCCSQCVAITSKKKRCKKRTCKTPYCYIHLKHIFGFRVQKSTLNNKRLRLNPGTVRPKSAGEGLFYEPTIKYAFDKRSGKFEFESPRKKKKAIQRATIKPGTLIPKLKYMVGNNEDGSVNTADELTYNEVEQRYPGDTLGAYVMCTGDAKSRPDEKRCVDAYKTNSNIARYINDSKGFLDKKNNVTIQQGLKKFTFNPLIPNSQSLPDPFNKIDKNKIHFNFATLQSQRLPSNNELFISYGPDYTFK